MRNQRSLRKRKRKTHSRSRIPPVLAVVGRAKSGKTTLVERLLHALTEKGYSVGTIKDARGGFQLDLKRKDSARHYRAGAQGVALVSAQQRELAFVGHLPAKLSIDELCERFFPDLDLIILEGFKNLNFPKIETARDTRLCCENDPDLLAVVGRTPASPDDVPCFTLRDVPSLVKLIEREFDLAPRQRG